MKPYLKERLNIILVVLIAVLLYMYFFHPKTEEVEIPVKVEVPVPVVEKIFDTIYKPKPVPYIVKGDTVERIDSTFYKKYLALQDSIKKDSLFREAIKIQEYKPFFEDDTIRIDVYAKVRGELLEKAISYKTKPRTITLDTTLTVPIPTRSKLFVGGGVRLPYGQLNTGGVAPVPYGGLYLKTKKDNLISLEFDTQSVSVGYAFKLKF